MSSDYADILAQCYRLSRLGLLDQAKSSVSILLDAPEDAVPKPILLDALTRLIWIEFHRGHHREAAEVAITAIALACHLQDPAREAIARAYHARVLCEGNDIIRAADEATAAVRIARTTEQPLPQSIALTILAIICSPLGINDAGVDLAREAIELAERSGDSEAIAHALINDGSIHADYLYRLGSGTAEEKQGFLTHAIQQTERARRLASAHDDGEMCRLAGFNLVEFLLMADRREQAEAVLRDSDLHTENASPRGAIHLTHIENLLQIARGDITGAIASLQRAIDVYIAYPFIELAVFSSGYLARALAQTGNFESAYYEQERFQTLSRQLRDRQGGAHLRSALVRDQVNELRAAISIERERIKALEKVHADLQAEADRLLQSSLEDPLTGTGNRRRMTAVVAELNANATPYAILLLDLDHFKAVNDRFSHLVGDAVIKTVATILHRNLSEQADLAGVAIRLGGEEFSVILVTVDQTAAKAFCERMRTAIEHNDWDGIATGLHVTASIGLAMSREGADDASRMALADARLYRAKHQGRNRVVADDVTVG
ncbi:GGDEF domain-containing protein [Acidisoma cellulosilytica]|uniref:diguanylate cyclase n=1 Tax=Acidisoma cellulosilyticum TaxID=2802395 RepID=A0A964E339_9PROT|nr:GGDEF domain-containing protein [Acidisoma cellulosilyticum]MCB8880051.1 GGDEF domain-containing protein [Acidisoma cellulosilyticum]